MGVTVVMPRTYTLESGTTARNASVDRMDSLQAASPPSTSAVGSGSASPSRCASNSASA